MTDRPWDWNEEELARFIAAARVGDLHTILDVAPDEEDLRAAVQRDDANGREYEHGWERLLALYLAEFYFKQETGGSSTTTRSSATSTTTTTGT